LRCVTCVSILGRGMFGFRNIKQNIVLLFRV